MAIIAAVDDEPEILWVLDLRLRQAGHEVVCIDGPVGALEQLREVMPDLLLLDLMMPAVDGLTLLRRLRLDPLLRPTPVMMFTAVSDPAAQAEAFELGAVDYIVKPPDWERLGERLRRHIR